MPRVATSLTSALCALSLVHLHNHGANAWTVLTLERAAREP